MKLIRINGEIWELSCLQKMYENNGRNVPTDEANKRVIEGKDISDVTRVLSGNRVRSKATAVIETNVCGLPTQICYDIYHNSKGFFCNVQGERIFLKELTE